MYDVYRDIWRAKWYWNRIALGQIHPIIDSWLDSHLANPSRYWFYRQFSQFFSFFQYIILLFSNYDDCGNWGPSYPDWQWVLLMVILHQHRYCGLVCKSPGRQCHLRLKKWLGCAFQTPRFLSQSITHCSEISKIVSGNPTLRNALTGFQPWDIV